MTKHPKIETFGSSLWQELNFFTSHVVKYSESSTPSGARAALGPRPKVRRRSKKTEVRSNKLCVIKTHTEFIAIRQIRPCCYCCWHPGDSLKYFFNGSNTRDVNDREKNDI